jgi:hypothetical protein
VQTAKFDQILQFAHCLGGFIRPKLSISYN